MERSFGDVTVKGDDEGDNSNEGKGGKIEFGGELKSVDASKDDDVKDDDEEADEATTPMAENGVHELNGKKPDETPSEADSQKTLDDKVADDTQKDKDDEFPNPFEPTFDKTDFIRKRLFARREKWTSIRPVR